MKAQVIVAVLAVTSAPVSAQCGGFCIYEVATPQMGSSYAGAGATAQDAATAYLNPAGMTRLKRVQTLVGGVASFVDSRLELNGDKTLPAGETNGGGQLGGFFPFGGMYLVAAPPKGLRLLEDFRFGFSFNNLYGGDLSYDGDWAGRSYVTDIRFYGLNIEPALAYRIRDWLSVGAGLHVLYYRLDFDFESALDPTSEAEVSGADGWEVSFTLGGLLEPRSDTRLGLVYRFKFDVDLRGEATVPPLREMDFGSSFVLPQGLNVSAFHELTSRWSLLADAGWSDWSQFNGQSSSFGPTVVADTRDWNDTWRLAAGCQYRVLEPFLGQAGVSYDSSPVPASNRLPDIPAGETYRFSLGLQWTQQFGWLVKAATVGLAYTFLWVPNADVDRVALPPARAVVLDGTYDTDNANLIALTLAAAF